MEYYSVESKSGIYCPDSVMECEVCHIKRTMPNMFNGRVCVFCYEKSKTKQEEKQW
jgi:hypothetical protein